MENSDFYANNQNFKKLIGDSIYYIPKFQRDYSWDNSNSEWDDLWNDINSNDEEKHYVGFIVLKYSNGNEGQKERFDVIDGQQRLTTITLIILSALKILNEFIKDNQNIDKKEENERLNDLIKEYIGKKDNITRKVYNKLELNDTNNNYFKYLSNLVIDENNTSCPDTSKKHKSNKLLQKAFDTFYKKIKEGNLKK